MHITNLVSDEDRPEGVRKPNSPSLDFDNWDTVDEQPKRTASDFAKAIAQAAVHADKTIESEQKKQKLRETKALALARLKAEADKIAEETGVSVGFDAWAYMPRDKAAYNLWKKVLPMFKERPEVLDLNVTALAKMLDEQEEGFTVTRDMLYDKLNDFAANDVERMLQKLGVTMVLRRPVSICSLRKQFLERRDGLGGIAVDEFSARFSIRGKTVFVNGRPYKIQDGKSGRPRIQYRGAWLRVDVLKAICSQEGCPE